MGRPGNEAWEGLGTKLSLYQLLQNDSNLKYSELLASFSGLGLQYAKMEGYKLSKAEGPGNKATDKMPSHCELTPEMRMVL